MATISPLAIPEILGHILGSHVLTPEELTRTSLVCKTWSVISRQCLWQVLELDTESWEDPFYHRLVTQLEQYGPTVRTLIIRECSQLKNAVSSLNIHIKYVIQGSDKSRFNAMLARMTNLQEILVDKIMLYQRSHVLLGLDRLPYRQLRHLRLPHVTSASGIELLLKVCNAGYGIQHLELMDSDIDDSTLQIIAELCPRLKSLDLSRNEVITFTEFLQGIEEAEEKPTTHEIYQQTPRQHLAQYPQEYQQHQEKDKYGDAQTRTQTLQEQSKKTNQPNDSSFSSSLHGPTTLSLPPHSLLHRSSTLLKDDAPFTYLEELNLVFCFGITDRDFQRLFRSFRGKSLRSLNLQFTNIEDSGLETLARTFYPTSTSTGALASTSTTTKGLTSLKVSYCNKITAKGIRTLVDQCPQLLELEFLSCDQVSAKCFMGHPWACTQLQRLEFTFHPMVVFSEKRRNVETEGGEQEVSHPQEQGQMQQSLQLNHDKHPQPPQQQQRTEDKEQENSDKEGHSDNNNGAPLDQELSVRRNYHAMFRQIKRLRRLRALHIYNSPLLNSKTHPSDQAEEGGEGEEGAVPAWVNVVFVDPSTPDATVGGTEVESEVESGSSSTSLDSHGSHEITYPMHSRQNNDTEASSSHGQEEEPWASPPPFVSVTMAPSISSSTSSCSSSSSPSSPSSSLPVQFHAHQPEAIHPFHLSSGLKALKTLQQLHTLTLYERCSVKLPEPEVRWIGLHLPQLRKLQLRGAIAIPEAALSRLQTRRVDIRVQVCSLFE
ncbi:hypothetical protein BGZ81_003029 [Podila clonocystis]|nr:hypothetical protein BGZ81_003029 [Podila clonocystis]